MTALWGPGEHAFPGQRLEEFLLWAAAEGASDIAFQTGEPALMDVDGKLLRATSAALDSTAMQFLIERMFNASGDGILRSGRAIDCSFAVREDRRRTRRFRVNISPVQVDHGFGANIVLRVLPDAVPGFEELGTEPEIVEAWELCRGLTLVTGVPGSGKSTLLAAGTRRLLENGAGRIQSFEAPIEYVFDGIADGDALMSSAEIPRHFATFADGLRSSLRRRPAAVIVGEARDRETVEAVVRAADYGIAVYSTAHTTGVAATVRRMLAEFPAEEREERGAALIDVLHMVVSQVLAPNPQGGLTALREWLVFDRDFKRELLGMPQSAWPAAISEEVERVGSSMASAAEAAHCAWKLRHMDLLRVAPAVAGKLPKAPRPNRAGNVPERERAGMSRPKGLAGSNASPPAAPEPGSDLEILIGIPRKEESTREEGRHGDPRDAGD